MSKSVDLSKPLSDKDIAELKQRHTLEYVDRLVALSAGSDFDDASEKPLTPAQQKAADKKAEKEKEAADKAAAEAAAAKPPADPASDTSDEVELDTYDVALTDGDPVRVQIPSDTDEDEIAEAVKAAAIEGGAEESNLAGFTKVEEAAGE